MRGPRAGTPTCMRFRYCQQVLLRARRSIAEHNYRLRLFDALQLTICAERRASRTSWRTSNPVSFDTSQKTQLFAGRSSAPTSSSLLKLGIQHDSHELSPMA